MIYAYENTMFSLIQVVSVSQQTQFWLRNGNSPHHIISSVIALSASAKSMCLSILLH